LGGKPLSIVLDLVKKARECGATFNFINGYVKIRAPQPLSEELLAELRKFKPEVISELRRERSELRKESECWLLEEWRKISIPDWREKLKVAIENRNVKGEEYARWMLKEMLEDPDFSEEK
jgi:hypothetical protein